MPYSVHTLIGSNAAIMDAGTRVPQSLIIRRKDEYVWMGMIPGMIGTLIPVRSKRHIPRGMKSKPQTFSSYCLRPSYELVDVVEELGHDKIGAGVHLGPQILDLSILVCVAVGVPVGIRWGEVSNDSYHVVNVRSNLLRLCRNAMQILVPIGCTKLGLSHV